MKGNCGTLGKLLPLHVISIEPFWNRLPISLALNFHVWLRPHLPQFIFHPWSPPQRLKYIFRDFVLFLLPSVPSFYHNMLETPNGLSKSSHFFFTAWNFSVAFLSISCFLFDSAFTGSAMVVIFLLLSRMILTSFRSNACADILSSICLISNSAS